MPVKVHLSPCVQMYHNTDNWQVLGEVSAIKGCQIAVFKLQQHYMCTLGKVQKIRVISRGSENT